MKKAILALLVVALAVVAGLVAFWPQVRLWQMGQALDRVLIPAIKAQYQATYGREPVITYDPLQADGSAFIINNFSLALAGTPEIAAKVTSVRVDKVDLGLLGSLNRCDLVLGQTLMEIKGLKVGAKTIEVKVTLAGVEAEGLSISDGGQRIRLARKFARDLEVTSPTMPKPLHLASVEARDYDLDASPQWKRGKGSLGKLVIKGDNGLEASLSQLSFDADTPTWKDGKAFIDLAKLQARQFALTLPGMPGPEPSLSIAEMNMTLSRKPERFADRVEIKGVAWKDKEGDKVQEALKELGYENLTLDLTYDYDYDRAAKVFECKEITLAVPQAGRLSVGFLLKNFTAEVGDDFPGNLEALKAARPESLTMRYEDASLADRALALGAKKEGLELEAFRAKVIKDLPPLPGALEPDPAVVAFIQKPGKLCLKVTPRQDMSAEDLIKTGPILLAMLNFQLDNCPVPRAGQ
jgi:hypothetical protein